MGGSEIDGSVPAAFLSRHRYGLLCVALTASLALQARHPVHGVDSFEHAAVIRELAARTWEPHHPLLGIRATHGLFSPYLVTLSLVARATGAAPFRLLAAAGFVNLALFLAAFPLATETLLGRRNPAFLALLFTLFLWGLKPWYWSGFLHFGVLGMVLGYPSFFAFGLALLGVWAGGRYLQRGGLGFAMVTFGLSLLVLLDHPISAAALWILLAAMAWRAWIPELRRRSVVLAAVIPASTVAALFWPYFPLANLLLRQAADYHANERPMYQEVLLRIGPGLLGLPFLIVRLRRDARDPVAIGALTLAGVYVFGWASGAWALGRTLPSIVLLLHLALADGLAGRQAPRLRGAWEGSRALRAILVATPVMVVAGVAWNFQAAFARMVTGNEDVESRFECVQRHVGADSLVLADLTTSGMLPAFAGKVVAVRNALPFVPDAARRREDLDRFFAVGAPPEERRSILERYRPQFLLFDRENLSEAGAIQSLVARRSRTVCDGEDLTLVALDPAATRP